MKNEKTKQNAAAMNLVLKCGVPPTLKGSRYLAEAVEMYAGGEYSFTDIYKRIAANNGVRPKSIMRDIAYALSQGFDFSQRLSQVLEIPIPETQMHSGLAISYLAIKLDSAEK